MSNWFYVINQTKTKVSEADLEALIRSGQLHGEHLIWTNGMETWQKVNQSKFAEVLNETEACAISGNLMLRSEMLQYGNTFISPLEKGRLVENLMQTGRAPFMFRLAASTVNFTVLFKSPELAGKISKWSILIGSSLMMLYALMWLLFKLIPELFGFIPIMGLFSVLIFVVFVFAVICYCVWLGHCVSNCRLNDKPLKDSGMMVAGYFIPVANLWIPFRCMKKLWRATMGEAKTDDDEESESKNGKKIALIDFWWAAWMAALLVFVINMFSFWDGGGLLIVVASALNLVAAIFIFKIIGLITRKQVERFGKSL